MGAYQRVAEHFGKDRGSRGVSADMSPWLSDRLLGSQSDERLVALACAGSDRAFAAIVQRYRRPLYAFARRLDANGEADDLVQQTFMSALAAMRSGVEVRHLRGWLHQIMRHAAIRGARNGELPDELRRAEPTAPSAQQSAELRLLALDALAAMAQLPDRQQEALVATALHGRSRAEVAQLLGLSEGAVRQLVHRARETLRAAITAITPYPIAQALAAGPSGGGVADAIAGTGAGSAGVVVLKVGALLASGVVAASVVSGGIGGSAHPDRRGHHASAARRSDPGGEASARLADVSHGGLAVAGHAQGTAGVRRGGDSRQSGSSPGGPQSGSSDGGGGGGDGGSGRSPGGPSATRTSSSDGGGGRRTTTTSGSDGGGGTTTTSGSDGGGGSGSRDGGQTTTTASTTLTTASVGRGGPGSGDTTTTTTATTSH